MDIYEAPEDLLKIEDTYIVNGEQVKMTIEDYIHSQVGIRYWQMFADEEAALRDMKG